MLVTTEADLRELVREYERRDSFVFDLETVYHPGEDERVEAERLREMSPKERTVDDKAFLVEYDMRATDERLNEVIWFGLATLGRSDAVACGHPNGVLLKPQRTEKISVQEAYPEGHPKRTTKSGMPSWAKVPRSMPAVFGPPPNQVRIDIACEILQPLMWSERRKINQNLRFDIRSLCKYYDGLLVPGPWGELQVALHLLDENRFLGWDLENFVDKVLGHHYDKLGRKGVTNYSFAKAAKYAEQDARFTWLLWTDAERKLRKNPVMWELFEFEMEVAQSLRLQELHGIKVNTAEMARLRAKHEAIAADMVDQLITDFGAPEDFNPNATLQKSALLYDKLGAQTKKLTPKTGNICVDAKALTAVVFEGGPAGAAAALMLEHAEHAKVIGTYFVGLKAKLHDDYLYPSFNQHQAVTGRLSCYQPNLHNIPRDSDIRAMFIADRGEAIISVDYDQIELRFICMLAEDETMRELFLGDADIHTATAALITGRKPEDIDPETRTVAGKTPNFLIGYGGGAYRLHQQTGIPVERAEVIIDRYFKTFKRILPWKMRELSLARSRAKWGAIDGRRALLRAPYVETMLGRRRRIVELANLTKRNDQLVSIDPRRAETKEEWKKRNGMVNAAERQAINAIVQGSAADTLKLAMVDIRRHLETTGFPLTPVLNVHDEIVAVCPEEHAEEGMKVLISCMENVTNPRTGEPPLRDWVPLLASGKIGDHWAKG